jgi:hypothetical protein
MAEVGLLPFARLALQVARVVLPRYRSRFSKAPIYPAAVARDSLLDALRRLDVREAEVGPNCARCWDL